MSEYPSDRQGTMFGLQYVRWLIESEITVEAGPDAFALLVAVVMAEDRIHYQRAPNFFNEQIQRHSGIGSLPALIRARTRAVRLGLLNYTPSAKRRPGVYFVTGFPNDSLRNPKGIRKESGRNPSPSIPNTQTLYPREKRPPFQKPSLEEIKAYCSERKNNVDPEQFFNHYTANGWVQGKGKPIRDWQAAVRTWENNGLQTKSKPKREENYPRLGAL